MFFETLRVLRPLNSNGEEIGKPNSRSDAQHFFSVV